MDRLSCMQNILSVEDVTKTIYLDNNPLNILKGISFSVKQSDTIAILGASGSGKTTLLSLLAGLDIATSGSIELLGQSLEALSEDERALLRLSQVGFVFQTFDLLPHLTAVENVMLPLELAKHKHPRQAALAMLEQVGLKERVQHYPNQLSGGEQQRVAIARAYVIEPQILFADEPTGSLDEATGDMILEQLFLLNKKYQTTLIFVTHDQTIAQQCQACYHLLHGELTPSEIRQS